MLISALGSQMFCLFKIILCIVIEKFDTLHLPPFPWSGDLCVLFHIEKSMIL